ncbi:DUF2799 domain-containing protein [Psychrobacter sp.]|uniref:DUF2799 domain-containing protein n=1 Tax=Psychrobacter sp. TaxID=56811 RepID=UPI00264725F2|nr:DUF2799 domain-containing protein [Psychrobacter sp.]MDN6276457.1 DUF2799 domain-containing protein [Psychrobacter sp.]MDN6308227.1 DUF2799 domain-containing protein [Psychrobacter sp.]
MLGFVHRLSLSLPVLGSIVLLSGCATLSKQECLIGDWETIGYNDGVSGYQSDRLASHAKACAKASVAPDYSAWERGRQQGLKQYCTTNNSYNLGKSGRDINNVCPASMASALERANQRGLDYYELESQIDEDNRLIDKYQDEFDKLESGDMLGFDSEKEARARLLSLADEIRKAKRRIYSSERQLDLFNQQDRYRY